MAEHVNASTSLARIKELVRVDFGVDISTETAKEIKNAAKNGTVIWTSEHCITTSGIKIIPGKQLA